MTAETTCVIVGGGPAGMVLGLLLARAGIEVSVLEKHGDFLRDFRGDTVHPSTQQLLDELGLGQRFTELPHSKLTEVVFPTADGGQVVFGDLKRLKVAHPYLAMVPQWDLLDLLANAAKAEPTFTLRMNTEVTGLITESGRVRGVRYRDIDGDGQLRAELTVGCDGRWSLVRAQTQLPGAEFPVPFDVWWFRLPRSRNDHSTALMPRMRNGQYSASIPRQGYFQIAYLTRKGLEAQLRQDGIERFRRRIAQLYELPLDRVELPSMDDVKHLEVRLDRLHRWYIDGLLCLGDAAHAMSPIGGVGINLAVQDAVAAARLLAEPLRRGHVTTHDLAKVQRRRWVPTVAVQALQRLVHGQIIRPVMQGRRDGPPAPLVWLLAALPQLSYIPAYLIGVGLRPERAPAFARR